MRNIKEIIKDKKVVAFTGAGISTNSGIPDFRSSYGLYTNNNTAEDILSLDFFLNNTKDFFAFYFDLIGKKYEPNSAHKGLAHLQKLGIVTSIISQNIDGLDTEAGSKNVIEVHGTIHKNNCMGCNNHFSLQEVLNLRDEEGIPRCPDCGLIIKPGITLYDENLNTELYMDAIYSIKEADILLILGTSLTAYPMCEIMEYFRGDYIIIVNNDKTEKDNLADIVIHEDISKFIESLI